MQGTIAVTDHGWYERLRMLPTLEEVNFWKPSATRTFHAEQFSPFFFKLRAPQHAICGFAFFARYSRLPDWLAWDCFQLGNGCASLADMRERIGAIRERIHYKGAQAASTIGCVLLVQPTFFPRDKWVPPPRDWPVRTQVDKKYDLSHGEGARIWAECRAAALQLSLAGEQTPAAAIAEGPAQRYGSPLLVTPRLGQGTFRVAVTEAYGKGCAITEEHSLPALEAGHIQPFASGGPNEVRNGLLLRADLHRLFDQGYVTVTPRLTLEVSRRLREDYANGRTYYPLHGRSLRRPQREEDRPGAAFLASHNEKIYLG